MINLLYFCGPTSFVKDTLLQRYFSQEVRASIAGSEVLMNYRRVCDSVQKCWGSELYLYQIL